MSMFGDLFNSLKLEEKTALVGALSWLVAIERGLKQTPAERLDDYERRRATGTVDTSDFTAADFERLSEIERKYGRA